MWFKNLVVYRLPVQLDLDVPTLEEQLSTLTLQPCGKMDRETRGWVSPLGNERLLHVVNQQVLMALGNEVKVLPSSVVNKVAAEKAAQAEQESGIKLGRKAMKLLKEQVIEELLPRAFATQKLTWVWIDPVHGWLVVDATTTKAEAVLEALSKSVDILPIRMLHTEQSPAAAMTNWLLTGEAPANFTIDRDLELRAADEGKATVRYVRHDLEGHEIGEHIAAGKQVTRVGMTWNDRISLVLGEQMEVKRLTFLDLLKEEADQAENAEEQLDADFALMCGEVAKMLTDLVDALGGEKVEA